MGYFVGELEISRNGTKHWKTLSDLLFVNNRGLRINVPAGFRTDGASIPRALWSVVGHPFNGKHARAAVIHDYMYHTGLHSKKEADLTFREAMKSDDVSWVRRWAMFYAVKWFGRGSFKAR